MSAESIHRTMFNAVNRKDFEGIRAVMHDEYTYTGGDGKEEAGPEAGMAVAEMYLGAFPDAAVEIRAQYVQGDVSIMECRVAGTHTGPLMGIEPTGKPISLAFCNVIEVRDGKVYREREYVDWGALLTQLGVIEPPGH